MKHTPKVIFVILAMFFITQLIGLAVLNVYKPTISQETDSNGNAVNITKYNLPYGTSPPEGLSPKYNLLSIVISICLAVAIILLLMRFKSEIILRYWFFFVVTLALGIAINAALINFKYSTWIALGVGLVLAFFKVFKRDLLVHNLTELLIYPGIAAIFVPLLSVPTAGILLVLISVYDIYAVWHAGFMQKMAKYQINEVGIFPGFFVPHNRKSSKNDISIDKKTKDKKKTKKLPVAILGGGDVVFPLILAGTVLRSFGIYHALIVSVLATISLAILFYYSEKGKFYPAMPFITTGCLAALAIIYIF